MFVLTFSNQYILSVTKLVKQEVAPYLCSWLSIYEDTVIRVLWVNAAIRHDYEFIHC